MAKSSLHAVEATPIERMKKDKRVSKQQVGVRNIHPDDAYQCRVKMEPEHVRRFQEKIKEDIELEPITLFFDTLAGKHILADGFHRLEASKREGVPNIWANVIDSDDAHREATLFAAETNLKFSLPLTIEDKKKAARKLLEDAEWWEWTDAKLAQTCDVSVGTVHKLRIERSAITGAAVPYRRRPRPVGYVHPAIGRRKSRQHLVESTGYIETNRKPLGVQGLGRFPETRMHSGDYLGSVVRLRTLGIECLPYVVPGTNINLIVSSKMVGVIAMNMSDAEIRRSLGDLSLSSRSHGKSHARVVICEQFDPAQNSPIVAAANLIGVKFSTPWDLPMMLLSLTRQNTGATSHATL